MTKLKKRFIWLASAGLLLALLLVTSIPIAAVQANGDPPALPHRFYGNVTINGSPAATGTTVAAWVAGTLNASTTVDSQGRYGYTPNFNLTGTSGQAITFYVGGSLAPQTSTFLAGGITPLNLAVSTTSLNVTTNAATNVSSMVATLNGNLTDMGTFSSVSVRFQYGTTPSYGSSTSTQTMTSGGFFSANISGLTPSTTYYFRAVATGGSTTVYGAPLNFNTTASTLSVSTTAASSALITSATLNGNLNDLGTNSSISVHFEYGPSIYYGYTTTAQSKSSTGNFNASVSSLISGTTYHYRAIAQGTTTVYGEDMTFTTSTGSLAVETNAATAVGSGSATLNGTLTSLGGASSGSVYFQYGTSTSYGSLTTSQLRTSGGAFNTSITGLSANTLYHFRAVAQAGSSTVNGSDASFTTLGSGGGSTAPPHQFYGNVYISGALAPSGTAVAAYVGGLPAASTTTDSSGRYGYTTLFLVPGTSGGAVTFYVGGTLVPQTATWTSGGITRLNLYSAQTALTVTCSATYATTTSATLSGTVTSFGPGDTSAAVSFEWGTSPSSLTTVTASPPAVTAAGQSFTATKTTLTAGTTYYYKAKAVGTSGTAYCPTSGTNTYIHTACSSTLGVTTNDATTGSGTATLSGTLTGVPASTSATLYFEYYPSGGSYPGTTVAGSPSSLATCGGFTYSASGLTNGTVYTYRAKAVGSTTVYGLDKTFTPGTMTRLIGTASDDSGSNDHNLNMLCLTRFAANANGNITEIRVKAREAGNVKAAIYDDSSGEPGLLRNATASMVSVVGWNTIPITSTPVNSGTYYWLAVKMDKLGGAIYNNTSGTMRYKIPVTYADAFPNPAGTGFTSGTFYGLVAGWGN